jgi:iron complex outermembrane receptor protein
VVHQVNVIGDLEIRNFNDIDATAPINWITNDLQLQYTSPWQGVFTLGAQNISAKQPPITNSVFNDTDYNFQLFNGDGRIVYASYTHMF